MTDQETLNVLARRLSLSDRARDVLAYRFHDGHTVEETAIIMGVPTEAVVRLLGGILRRLEERLHRHDREPLGIDLGEIIDAMRGPRMSAPPTPEFRESRYTGELQQVKLREPYPQVYDVVRARQRGMWLPMREEREEVSDGNQSE